MPSSIKTIFIFLCLFILSNTASADPWFTGPIFAGSGHTIPRGHTNFEIYAIDVANNGRFNATGRVIHTPNFDNNLYNAILSHGFTDWMDIQLSIPYLFNSTQGVSYNRLGDSSVGMGLQIIEQKKHRYLPDVRFFLQEIFPTGKYDHLDPLFLGTDATGLGSYRTNINLNLQYLAEVFNDHFLRTRLVWSHLYSSPVNVQGVNILGGTSHAQGTINPGVEDDIDLAFELTLTQNWVAVLEGYYTQGQSTNFNGILDIINDGPHNIPLRGNFYEAGLAPAIEYNFTSNIGIIGGVWFPIDGKNTSHFVSYVLALNAFW